MRGRHGNATGTLFYVGHVHGNAPRIFREHPTVNRYMEISVACVDPTYGARGIGRRMFELALEAASTSKEKGGFGCEMAFVMVSR